MEYIFCNKKIYFYQLMSFYKSVIAFFVLFF
jgi:hypothetical protein